MAMSGASATPVEAPKIALTFDDGPSTAWTPALLDGLKERGVKATFFLIGENADKNPEIVKRMAEEGHLIGNHTYHHVELTKVSENEARLELADTSAVIVRITRKRAGVYASAVWRMAAKIRTGDPDASCALDH